MIFIGILSVIAIILLWDIYKQLRYLNRNIGLLIETIQNKEVINKDL